MDLSNFRFLKTVPKRFDVVIGLHSSGEPSTPAASPLPTTSAATPSTQGTSKTERQKLFIDYRCLGTNLQSTNTAMVGSPMMPIYEDVAMDVEQEANKSDDGSEMVPNNEQHVASDLTQQLNLEDSTPPPMASQRSTSDALSLPLTPEQTIMEVDQRSSSASSNTSSGSTNSSRSEEPESAKEDLNRPRRVVESIVMKAKQKKRLSEVKSDENMKLAAIRKSSEHRGRSSIDKITGTKHFKRSNISNKPVAQAAQPYQRCARREGLRNIPLKKYVDEEEWDDSDQICIKTIVDPDNEWKDMNNEDWKEFRMFCKKYNYCAEKLILEKDTIRNDYMWHKMNKKISANFETYRGSQGSIRPKDNHQ